MTRLDKSDFGDFIRELAEGYDVYAPGLRGSTTIFVPVGPDDDIVQDCTVTVMSPKNVFFPQAEVLFEYENGEVRTIPASTRPLAVWGMRGCDVRSLHLLDKVMGDAIQMPGDKRFQDPYWKERFDDSIIFCTACNEPLSTCFCNWFGGGPHSGTGADVFVIDIGEAWLMEPMSEKGTELIAGISCLKDVSDDDLTRASELAARAESLMTAPDGIEGIDTHLTELFDAEVWDKISAKCVTCGACTFCCPTCHCFDLQDEGSGGRGKRIRIWDSCMFPIFTAEASGHNPRALSKERVRQRIMHKFSYYPERYGEMLCTGCGRCISACPVNFDVRDVLRELQECES